MPSTPPRRRLTPSMVLSIAALIVALGGTAVAARRYLINSTGQIRPSVLAKLTGQTGPAGAKGDAGTAGTNGTDGTNGSNGNNGSNGTSSALTLANETAGANCTNGGTKVTVDSPAQTRYVCNGANGSDGSSGGTTSRQTIAGEATTTSTGEVELDGPSVTVNIPAGGANVIVGANFDSKNATGTNNSWAAVYEGNTRLNGVGGGASSAYVRRHGGIQPFPADAGSHTYTMRYQSQSGTVASFQDRTLIVTVLG